MYGRNKNRGQQERGEGEQELVKVNNFVTLHASKYQIKKRKRKNVTWGNLTAGGDDKLVAKCFEGVFVVHVGGEGRVEKALGFGFGQLKVEVVLGGHCVHLRDQVEMWDGRVR